MAKHTSKSKNAFPFHPPLIISAVFAIILGGLTWYIFAEKPPAWLSPHIPSLLLRYAQDPMCVTIFTLFLACLSYSFMQYLGLWTHQSYIIHIVEGAFDACQSNTPRENSIVAKATTIVTGRCPLTYQSLAEGLCQVRARNGGATDQAAICRDMVAGYESRLNGDLYAINFGIWALPILGFIGTVWGISQSISGLRKLVKGSAAPETLMSDLPVAMGKVLQGLSTAFDTTFLGLSFAAILMLPFLVLRRKINNQLMEDYSRLLHLTCQETPPQKMASDGS